MIRYFESPADMANFAHANCANEKHWNNDDTSWAGDKWKGISAMLANGGDDSDVPKAMELMEKLSMLLPETEGAEFVPSVAGAYPCVPDALLGLPEPMRARAPVLGDSKPIKLGVVTTVSAGIDARAFRAKSAAMLAILLHLANSGRAVELYGISTMQGSEGGETVLAYRIPSAPLSMAECNMALGNLAFARRIPFAIGETINGFNGKWPRAFDESHHGRDYCADLAARMGFNMILPPLHYDEAESIVADPAEWMTTKYNAIQAQITND